MSPSENIYGLPESDPGIYLNRDMAAVAKRWNAKAARWDADLKSPACHLNADGAYDSFLTLAKKLVSERLNLCASGMVVDLGCGTGLVLAELAPCFRRSIGVDISSEMLSLAAAKLVPNVEWRLGDAFDGHCLSPKPAAVVSRGVLISHYGFELAELLLDRVAQALEAGGFALLDFLSAEAPPSLRSIAPNKAHFSPGWITDLARRVGFKEVAIEGNACDRVRYLVLR